MAFIRGKKCGGNGGAEEPVDVGFAGVRAEKVGRGPALPTIGATAVGFAVVPDSPAGLLEEADRRPAPEVGETGQGLILLLRPCFIRCLPYLTLPSYFVPEVLVSHVLPAVKISFLCYMIYKLQPRD